MSLIAATALTALTLVNPPAGRPPEGPLVRSEARIYDVGIEVNFNPPLQYDQKYQQPFQVEDAPIVMPMIFMSTYSKVDPDSLRGSLWLNETFDDSLGDRLRLDTGYPFGTQLFVLTIPKWSGHAIRWEVTFRAMAWSSEINEAHAARIAWPREWPKEVQDGLRPQMYIQSDDPIFAETIERITEGRLRFVPPYHAAKEIVRYCILNVRTTGDGDERRNLGMLAGMQMNGALQAAKDGLGSPHDLVSVCIAMLRAAGIPARPVIGITEEKNVGFGPDGSPRGNTKTRFVTWGEFYLPEAGWVPFDPNAMGNGVRTKRLDVKWDHFGTMDELNERVPLSFHYVPPAQVEVPEFPAVWGWDPRPESPRQGLTQAIKLKMTDRGKARVP